MDENRSVGLVKNIAGKIEEGVGEVTGDPRMQVEGKLTQGIGKVQSAIGSAIDQLSGTSIGDRAASLAKQATEAGEKAITVVQDAAQKIGAQASDVGGRLSGGARSFTQSLGQAVEEQPLTSVLIAAALGYAIARLLHAER